MRKHPNWQSHNWLVYKYFNFYFQNYKHLLKGRVVDLGCGETPYKDLILQSADSYTGIDWGNTLHASKADILADLNKNLPINDEEFDSALSISVMEHLLDPKLFLKETYRILKPGGVFILQVPWQWGIHEAPFDFYRYTPYALEAMTKEAGFVKCQISEMGNFFASMALKRNYFSRRLIRVPKFIRIIIKVVFYFYWQFNQYFALVLGPLDRNQNYECSGYFCILKKKL